MTEAQTQSISIKFLEENLPEELTHTICKLAHTSNLKTLHEELRLSHYISVFKNNATSRLMRHVIIDTMYSAHPLNAYIYQQNHRLLVMISHYHTTITKPLNILAVFVNHNLAYLYADMLSNKTELKTSDIYTLLRTTLYHSNVNIKPNMNTLRTKEPLYIINKKHQQTINKALLQSISNRFQPLNQMPTI